MARKCSHCGYNGHNSRTCPDRGVLLFGVRLTENPPFRKSLSMGNLIHYNNSHPQHHHHHHRESSTPEQSESGDGYVSDGLVQTSNNARHRKKGVPWTEEEHRMFLAGLQKLGKGDWRGIARNYVTSRTPTQVASHAQKYFIRQSNNSKRKRRSSLFDIPPQVHNTQRMELNENDLTLGFKPFTVHPHPQSTVTPVVGIRSEEPGSDLTQLSLGTNTSSSSASELKLEQPRHGFRSTSNKPISVGV